MADLPPNPTPYVFLSYASVERERALEVAETLERAGVRVWLDRHAISGGSAWSAAIVDGITGCAAFIVLGSERAFASPNVQRELNLAVEENRPLLPLLLERCEQPREVRYALAGRQWVALLDRPTEAWFPDVLRALAGFATVVAKPAETAALPAPATSTTDLPSQLTSFLGRAVELAALDMLLATNRLVTLTGPGGTGKTRLALAAASAAAAAFPDGLCFVDLAPVQDPTLVPAAVAQALGAQGNPDLSLRDSVLRCLRDKRLLLVLDNYEHLLVAAEFASALLQAGPAVTLLVTSRAPLRVRGEREYPVPPLPLPQTSLVTAAALAGNPTVALFVTRARDVRPDFVLTDENAAIVAAICTRLDGLPLAIELAAARVRVLPPPALLARLTQRLPVLTGGSRDTPARQQTLRDTIAWSFDLLTQAEQRLFRRLAVFGGGCTLELVEAVCNADGDLGLDVLDGVSSLLEKSLLREVDAQSGEPRYRMLETIREFALGELEASREAETVRRQLAVQVLQLVRRYATAQNWAQLDTELDNARAVLDWCVDRAELGVGTRLAWALQEYLLYHGGQKKDEAWRRRLLALPEASRPGISRARLLTRIPSATSEAEQEQYATELMEAIGLSRELRDQMCLGIALRNLSELRLHQGRYDDADQLAEEAVPLLLAAGATTWAVLARGHRMQAAIARGELATAEALLTANQATAGNAPISLLRYQAALLAETRGDLTEARRLLEDHVRRVTAEQGDAGPARLFGLAHLAWVVLRQGDIQASLTACAGILTVQHRIGPERSLPAVLSVLALAAEAADLLGLSTRLSSAILASKQPPHLGSAAMVRLHAEQLAAVERVQEALGEPAFTTAWASGKALSLDGAIELGREAVTELQEPLAKSATQ